MKLINYLKKIKKKKINQILDKHLRKKNNYQKYIISLIEINLFNSIYIILIIINFDIKVYGYIVLVIFYLIN